MDELEEAKVKMENSVSKKASPFKSLAFSTPHKRKMMGGLFKTKDKTNSMNLPLKRSHMEIQHEQEQDDDETSHNPNEYVFGIEKEYVEATLDSMLTLITVCPFTRELDIPTLVLRLQALKNVFFLPHVVHFSFHIPNPILRLRALQMCIDSELYLYILHAVQCVFYTEGNNMSLYDDGDAYLVHCVFASIFKKGHVEILQNTPFEQAYDEYVADTTTNTPCDIDDE